MKIKVKLFANFREATKQKEVEISPEGDSVKAVIKGLVTKYPNIEPLLFQDGALKPYVNVLHNGQTVKGEEGLTAKIKDGDEIALFPPVSGG
ncbi:ubiquitin-like small modifier protein 1 [Methanocella arvoryzae]|uniref:ThiS/MoaD sulfur transfer protein n=1 Tax=Methanocella arvoryzae (strain DSM 22066 / NBRC 105507 / MRE50) TaxID=351160 RepID=Q0W477_METAR|nr:ubiquitin-like small modifier protein 1 [Methanocella arvoryzae]CAJ36816.1 ThiS/MoaD sulfur transfer protein [Methanocella arvoryzae MRE50]